MSGYTPVFQSVFQGSLCGKFPDLPVWLVLLALANKHGEIDAHPSYIAMVSGIPQSDVEAAITRFCEPDQSSRTPDDDGRRLIPLPNRGFGWSIVNHGKYREKARLAAKSEREVESGANAARLHDRRRPPVTAAERPSDADADSNKETERARKRASRRAPEDFKIQPEHAEWAKAEAPGVDILAETRKFKDHTFATARTDWDATWRNWMRRATPTKPVVQPKREPTQEEITAAQRAAAEANKRELARKLNLPGIA